MRWMISVRYVLVIMSVLFGTFVAAILGYHCSGLLRFSDLQDDLPNDSRSENYLQFPCDVTGTELSALALVSYEGTFLEDGGDSEVANIAALLVRNNSARHIYDGQIEVKQGKRVLIFQITHLPGHGEILVIERNRQSYFPGGILGCEGKTRSVDSNGWTDKFSVIVTGHRDVVIKNLTGQQFKNVVVYYKTYYAPAGFYVGGITHSVRIDVVGAREEIQLLPRPFVSDSGLVVWVAEGE